MSSGFEYWRKNTNTKGITIEFGSLNGKPTVEIPLCTGNVLIGKEGRIDKNNDIITHDMIVKWQARNCRSNNGAFMQDTRGMTALIGLVGDCLASGVYSVEDIANYIRGIEQQKIQDITSKACGDQLWIEMQPGDDVQGVPYICFPIDVLKNNNGEPFKVDRKLERGECAYFVLDENTKYVFFWKLSRLLRQYTRTIKTLFLLEWTSGRNILEECGTKCMFAV